MSIVYIPTNENEQETILNAAIVPPKRDKAIDIHDMGIL